MLHIHQAWLACVRNQGGEPLCLPWLQTARPWWFWAGAGGAHERRRGEERVGKRKQDRCTCEGGSEGGREAETARFIPPLRQHPSRRTDSGEMSSIWPGVEEKNPRRGRICRKITDALSRFLLVTGVCESCRQVGGATFPADAEFPPDGRSGAARSAGIGLRRSPLARIRGASPSRPGFCASARSALHTDLLLENKTPFGPSQGGISP